MLDHIGLSVSNLGRSVRFYQALLAPLGIELCSQDESSAGFGPKGAPAFWLYPSTKVTTGIHVAFRAKHQGDVKKFHAAGLEGGGKDNGAAGVRKDYAPNYYAAFVLDPDGNNVEAVWLS
jgi:catechol 2,3-dioxygenase-like lactoylglutathione lyase family enzyme